MWVLYNYIIDWEEFNLIAKLVEPHDVVFDVGANIGVYTVWMSQFINQSGRIHAFEPDAENFQKLENHISLNQITDRTTTNRIALAEAAIDLFFTTMLDGENHISNRQNNNNVKITAQSLDQYAKISPVDFIKYLKIDVEGFELSVLKGAANLLKNKKILVIQLEINKTLINSNTTVEELLNYLLQYGYQLCGYRTKENRVYPITFSQERENYFAIANIDMVNSILEQK
jgi:FkbM family methyltransferase